MSSFEDILKTPFRWPREGDSPFQASSERSANAQVEETPATRVFLMAEGYKIGADLMVEKAAESGYQRDCLVYPIIFNYRHYLELSLKILIALYGPTVGVPENWKTHDLVVLWKAFKQVLVGYGDEDPDGTDPVVESILAEFAKIDPRSYAWRYPVDRSGQAIPVTLLELDLAVLKDVMKAMDGYFTGCDGYLDHLSSAGP